MSLIKIRDIIYYKLTTISLEDRLQLTKFIKIHLCKFFIFTDNNI